MLNQNEKVRIHFEFEGTLEQLESAIMRIAMHPEESKAGIKEKETKPANAPVAVMKAAKESKPVNKPAKVKGNKYNKTLTIEQAKAAIAKHKPIDIPAVIKAIMAECGCSGSAIGRLINLSSFMISSALNGTVYPKTIKQFDATFGIIQSVPVDGPLSIDRIKATIASVKSSCLAALIAELKKRYSLVDVSKLMSVTSEALLAAEKGNASNLVLNVFRTRLGFPPAMTE
jgi:hypothetical protein